MWEDLWLSSLGTSRCVRGTATCVPGKWFSPLSKLEVMETDYQHDIWDYIVAGGQRSRITEISHSCMWLYFPAIVPWSVNDEICRLTAWSTTKWSPYIIFLMISGHGCMPTSDNARQQSIMATDTWLLFKLECLESCSGVVSKQTTAKMVVLFIYIFRPSLNALSFSLLTVQAFSPSSLKIYSGVFSHILHKESNSVRSVSNKTMSYVCCMRQTHGIGYKWNTSHYVASLLKLYWMKPLL